MLFSSDRKITIGDDVLLGWNVHLRDSDGHQIYVGNEKKMSMKEINIGDHIWLASNVSILKGVCIANGCVVAFGACVIDSFDKQNSLIGGFPAKLIAVNIRWEK